MSDPYISGSEYTPFPFPSLQPLTRLHVKDSLRINSDRWQLAHGYHRHRQNLHYQALWEPGIVCGLGVKPIKPPADVEEQFKDQRWIEIQPGIAIDIEGNPIVVGDENEPEEKRIDRQYRIAAPTPLEGTRLLRVVLRYVDPGNLDVDVQNDRVTERFRFDQRIGELHKGDIELCRITLTPGDLELKIPEDPFSPRPNTLDLRYRRFAQQRPQCSVHVGTLTLLSEQKSQQWKTLLASVKNLHHAFQCRFTEDPVTATDPTSFQDYDLLYVSSQTLLKWLEKARETSEAQRTLPQDALGIYLQSGGLLYVEVNELDQPLYTLLQSLGLARTPVEPLPKDHPIRRQPFHFGLLPLTEQGSLELKSARNVLMVSSALAAAWDSDQLPRHEIRSAQELGVNILHFAWQNRYYKRLLS